MYKDKILAELNKKYLGLSKKVLGLIADKLSAKVTEESQIEGVINELENMPISVKDFGELLQKEGDERVTAAQKKWKLENPEKPAADPKPEGGDEPDPRDKKLAEIERKLAELDRKEKRAELVEKAKKALTEKKIPHRLLNGRNIDKDEDLEIVLAEIDTDWADMKQELANQGFIETQKPINGNGGELSKKAAESAIERWAKKSQVDQPAAKP